MSKRMYVLDISLIITCQPARQARRFRSYSQSLRNLEKIQRLWCKQLLSFLCFYDWASFPSPSSGPSTSKARPENSILLVHCSFLQKQRTAKRFIFFVRFLHFVIGMLYIFTGLEKEKEEKECWAAGWILLDLRLFFSKIYTFLYLPIFTKNLEQFIFALFQLNWIDRIR